MYDAQDIRGAPRVSVVMPVHNAAAFLVDTLASVRAQTMPDWELVAVDDGSTDGCAQILAEAAKIDPRIHLLSTDENRGAGHARNLGMDAARGRYVAFLDADDLWHPEKLALHLDWLRDQAVGLSFTAYQRHNLQTGKTDGIGVPARVSYHQLLATNVIGCSTVILDRAILGELRMPGLRLRQDFAFWLAILQKHGPARGLPVALTTYRQHPGQVSGGKRRAARATWSMYREHLSLGRAQAGWCFTRYALRGILRHRAPGAARALGWLQEPILPGSPEAAGYELAAKGSPILTIAIATTAERLGQIDIAALPALRGVAFRIFIQGLEPAALPPSPRADVSLISSDGRGAARNRNAALQTVTTSLLLFADDDLRLEAAGITALIARFAAHPRIDFLCARLSNEAGHPRKRYCSDASAVRWWNSAKTGTPELALRQARFRACNLRFDEAFGAGTPNYLGDEYIFVCDALRAGLHGQHAALILARHPQDSSGTRHSAETMAIRKRVLIRALGRWRGRPACWAFALRHWRQFSDLKSLLRFL